MWTDEFLAWEIDDTRPKRQTHNPGPVAVTHGRGAGPAVGANLETLLHLAGTPYWPDLSGHVLLLEATVPTRLSVLARDLAQLRLTGALDDVAAIGLGRLGSGNPDERADEVVDLLRRTLGACGGPVVAGLDIGHTDPMWCVPYGDPEAVRDVCPPPASEVVMGEAERRQATHSTRLEAAASLLRRAGRREVTAAQLCASFGITPDEARSLLRSSG